MLRADGFRAATVVRSTDFGHTTAIGIQFDVPQRLGLPKPFARAA